MSGLVMVKKRPGVNGYSIRLVLYAAFGYQALITPLG